MDIRGRVCITKTEKAESEAQRSKPKGALGSESRNAILLLGERPPRYNEGEVCVLLKREGHTGAL